MEAVWMSVKRFSQLKKHSMGWRTELANVENVSPETSPPKILRKRQTQTD